MAVWNDCASQYTDQIEAYIRECGNGQRCEMKIVNIQPICRNENGRLTAGYVTFDDGKEWKFSTRRWEDPFFSIDSGMSAQTSFLNYSRNISPPKRIAVLINKLIEMGEVPK